MIKLGDKLPAGKLQEYIEVEGGGCWSAPFTAADVTRASGRRLDAETP